MLRGTCDFGMGATPPIYLIGGIMPGGVRIDDELYVWLMDQKSSKLKSISDVIGELKEFKEQHQKD